jgi:hypothetical protein
MRSEWPEILRRNMVINNINIPKRKIYQIQQMNIQKYILIIYVKCNNAPLKEL